MCSTNARRRNNRPVFIAMSGPGRLLDGWMAAVSGGQCARVATVPVWPLCERSLPTPCHVERISRRYAIPPPVDHRATSDLKDRWPR